MTIAGMGLEDRDWYREEASPEWKRIVTGADVSPSGRRSAPSGSDWARTRKPFKILAVIIGALAVAVAWADRGGVRGALNSIRPQHAAPTVVVPPSPVGVPASAPSPSNVIHLGDRPGLDTPVTTVSHWWVDVDSIGRVEVYVPLGETPRQALTVALAERGYQVIG